MNVRIWDDKYSIKSDARCYRLVMFVPGKEDKDEETEATVGYYNSLEHLFKALAEREGRLNKCTTLEGYIKHIEKVNAMVEENLEKIKAVVGQKESFERIMSRLATELPENENNADDEEEKSAKTKKKK